MDPVEIIRKHYGRSPDLFSLLEGHCRRVAEKALSIADSVSATVDCDREFIRSAAMLHDIGIGFTHAPKILCTGTEPYIRHGVIGRAMLEDEGMFSHALVCERHVGAGLSREEIRQAGLPLPDRDMLPVSLEEIIICVADKFFSKSKADKENPLKKILKEVESYGPGPEKRFRAWLEMLGIRA